MSRARMMPLIVPMLLGMSGCGSGSPEPVRTISDYCPLTDFITYAPPGAIIPETTANDADTPATIAQIERHNSKRACICEGDCPSRPEPAAIPSR